MSETKSSEDLTNPYFGHGPQVSDSGILYRLWSPQSKNARVLVRRSSSGDAHALELKREAGGWFSAMDAKGQAGDLYEFLLDDSTKTPDVASRFQPQGVRGPSQVIDETAFPWANPSWKRPDAANLVIYELHIGAFTSEGTFASAIPHLQHIHELGANAIQLMPVSAFPGERNWGYDVVLPYAPANSYGRPNDLRRLIDAAHALGLAVIIDVVYNHVCGEPNHLHTVSPRYFRKEGGNAWGDALNFDEPAVRAFFLHNAEYWFDAFHADGLRLDATHAIVDHSPVHILQQIADAAHARQGFVIAEDDRNEARLLKPASEGGLGMDAVWADDFHHVLKMSLKPEPIGHFKSYTGSKAELVETLDHGWLFRGQYFSQWRKPRGSESRGRPPAQFVYCISNHDQTGNRPVGERLNHLISPAAYRAASMLFLLIPYTPMLFMGQEWAASSAFVFFTNHGGSFGAMVSKGRLNEFKQFGSEWPAGMLEAMPDPEDVSAFKRSKLDWRECAKTAHQQTNDLYRECLKLRRDDPVLRQRQRGNWKVWTDGVCLFVQYGMNEPSLRLLVAHLNSTPSGPITLPKPIERDDFDWKMILSSEHKQFGGTGSPSFDPEKNQVTFSGPETILLAFDK